jgi:hypothetical protein
MNSRRCSGRDVIDGWFSRCRNRASAQSWKDAQAMPPRGPEAAIAKFLRDALARDDVGVPTLEVMARRAGLLGEHQRITHAKLFRAAKKTLGIRSRRAGFGARSQWLWQLPRQNKTSRKPEPGPERRATEKPRVPIPIDWVEGVCSLDDRHSPHDVPRHRRRARAAAGRRARNSKHSTASAASRLPEDGHRIT